MRAAVFILLLALSSCTAVRVATLPEERPPDLVVSVTVYAPQRWIEGTDDEAAALNRLPRSLRPARYVIETDSSLRAITGAAVDAMTFPPRVRQLTSTEMQQLWRQIRESGLLDPGNPARIQGAEATETPIRSAQRTTALIFISFEGSRTTLRTPLDRSTPESTESERLVDRLAGWAWAQ